MSRAAREHRSPEPAPPTTPSAVLGAQPVRRPGPGEGARNGAATARTGPGRRGLPTEARATWWRGVARAMEWPSVRLDRATLWAWRRHHDAADRLDRMRPRRSAI